MKKPAIEVRELYLRYAGNKKNTINGVSFAVERGETVALMGMSGCGKSSLCYCICGIIPGMIKARVMGDIELFGEKVSELSIAERAKKIGIVFQEPDNQLFSPTIEDEIAFAPENLCIEHDEIGEIIKNCLDAVGMSKYRLSSPERLSGGQKQLIALASVLAMDPEILVFDEAMSQLDEDGKQMIRDMILKLKNQGKTILMVEHDIKNAQIADRILVMRSGKLFNCEGELCI